MMNTHYPHCWNDAGYQLLEIDLRVLLWMCFTIYHYPPSLSLQPLQRTLLHQLDRATWFNEIGF
jgi:hypothetical protein